MLRTAVPVLFLVLAAVPHPQSSRSATPPDLRTAIDSFVGRKITADSFSGVVLYATPGSPVYTRVAGIANRETGAAITVDTKMQIASATKLFTQIAIRQLEQTGKLSLSDTVGKFLPGYHNPIVRSRVTVDQLLTHRSGVGSFWNERFRANPESIRSIADYISLFQDDSLLFAPGTDQAYSNGGYVILGAIIERVSGQAYHDYLRDHVFGPAGMTATMPYDRRQPRANSAIGYTFQPIDAPVTGDHRLAGAGHRPGYEAPAGATAIPPSGMRMRIIGPDGKDMNPEDARAAMAARAAGGMPRRSNLSVQAGVSGSAGDHYSTVGDLLALAQALVGRKLLDSSRTAAVLGNRFAQGSDFRANGGGPGSNAELSIFPSGGVMVVLSNYDPPAATSIAEFIRSRVAVAHQAP